VCRKSTCSALIRRSHCSLSLQLVQRLQPALSGRTTLHTICSSSTDDILLRHDLLLARNACGLVARPQWWEESEDWNSFPWLPPQVAHDSYFITDGIVTATPASKTGPPPRMRRNCVPASSNRGTRFQMLRPSKCNFPTKCWKDANHSAVCTSLQSQVVYGIRSAESDVKADLQTRRARTWGY
jgi:hypothetical protein